MNEIETDAIIIKTASLGEKDKLVTLYTEQSGLLRLAVKHGKKITSSSSGLLQIFNWNTINYYQGNGLARLMDVDLKYAFPKMKQDLKKVSYGNYVIEFYYLTGTSERNTVFFKHLLLTLINLEKLDKDIDYEYFLVIFHAAALAIIGYELKLDGCCNCKNSCVTNKMEFVVADGSLYCSDCITNNMGIKFTIDRFQLEFLKEAMAKGFSLENRFDLNIEQLNNLNLLLKKFISYHLNLSFKTEKFISAFS
ncbi:MAG: DNA repair protein RecO [Bacillota bacterium]